MKTLKIGIASYEEMKARTIAITRGEYKSKPDEPKVWFTSPESFAKVLSDRNRALLRVISESSPGSLTELAELTGRKKSNLSRTLKARSTTLLRPRMCGIVNLRQMLEIQMRVDLGRADVGMPQQLLYGAQIAAGLQQVTGKRMA